MTCVIEYVSELTGSGKTIRVLREIIKSKDKFIIALPNIDLCEEIAQTIEKHSNSEFKVVNTKTSKSPSNLLRDTLLNPKNVRIVITTHASLGLGVRQDIYHQIGDWNLFIDEEMASFTMHEMNVSELSKDILDGMVDVEEYDKKEAFYRIIPKRGKVWEEISQGVVRDSFMKNEGFLNFIRFSMSPEYDTIIPKEIYHKYMSDTAAIDKGKFKKFLAISVLNKEFYEAFKSVQILCSFFEKTITYLMLVEQGIELVRKKLPKMPVVHSNSHLINIHYFTEKNWSNSVKNTPMWGITAKDQRSTLEQEIRNFILHSVKNKDFIYNANRNARDGFGSGTLVTSVYGVNRYIDHTVAAFLPSLNATAGFVSMMSHFGIPRQQIDFSRNVLGAYQFVSRCAVRKTNNTKEVNIYVMDRRSVDFLRQVFPDAKAFLHDWTKYFIKEEKVKKVRKTKEKTVSASDRAFVCRVRKRLREGENVRASTLKKFEKVLDEFYR